MTATKLGMVFHVLTKAWAGECFSLTNEPTKS